MFVYRALLDFFVVEKVAFQKALLEEAEGILRNLTVANVKGLVRDAINVLSQGFQLEPPLQLQILAAMLFQGSGLQLSEMYGGRPESGNSLDTAPCCVTNVCFYNSTLRNLLASSNSSEHLLVEVTALLLNPVKMGIFYDNLGSFDQQPHLVKGNVTWIQDPSFYAHVAREYTASAVTNSR